MDLEFRPMELAFPINEIYVSVVKNRVFVTENCFITCGKALMKIDFLPV